MYLLFVFCQAEDGIRDLVRSRGLGDVYKRQRQGYEPRQPIAFSHKRMAGVPVMQTNDRGEQVNVCLLYTSDAADERSSVDLGGRRIIKKKNKITTR